MESEKTKVIKITREETEKTRNFLIKKQLIKIFFEMLPSFLIYKIIRSQIFIDYDPDPRLKFKIASTKEELSSAFKILHDEYVKNGYMDSNSSGMRITIFHELPETTTLIGLWEGRVVATVSIIKRTVIGLPIECIYDISHILQEDSNCVEISALAVEKSFQKKQGEILFPLLKFLTEYCKKYLNFSCSIKRSLFFSDND